MSPREDIPMPTEAVSMESYTIDAGQLIDGKGFTPAILITVKGHSPSVDNQQVVLAMSPGGAKQLITTLLEVLEAAPWEK